MDYNAPITQESFDEMSARPNQADDRPEFVEVIVRAVRRLEHAIDQAIPKDPAEPFDLAGQIDALRPLVQSRMVAPGNGDGRLLAFLYQNPDGDGPFDRAIWLEVLALTAGLQPRATDDLSAQAHAMATVIRHVMSRQELIAALNQDRSDREALGAAHDTIDLNLPTAEDRRRHAMRDVLGIAFFLDEYWGLGVPRQDPPPDV